MALVRYVTQVVEIPGEGQRVTVRALNWQELDEAERLGKKRSLDDFKDLASVFKDIKEILDEADDRSDEVSEQREAMRSDPLFGVDRETVLKHGIVEWSYEGDPKTDYVDLDAPTAKLVGESIMRLTKRSVAQGES